MRGDRLDRELEDILLGFPGTRTYFCNCSRNQIICPAHQKQKQAINKLLATERTKAAIEASKVIQKLKNEYVNTPLDKRNGWKWLLRAEKEIYELANLESKGGRDE